MGTSWSACAIWTDGPISCCMTLWLYGVKQITCKSEYILQGRCKVTLGSTLFLYNRSRHSENIEFALFSTNRYMKPWLHFNVRGTKPFSCSDLFHHLMRSWLYGLGAWSSLKPKVWDLFGMLGEQCHACLAQYFIQVKVTCLLLACSFKNKLCFMARVVLDQKRNQVVVFRSCRL